MRVITVFVASLFFLNAIEAQERQFYVVKAGEIPAEVIPTEAIFHFPRFKVGIVYMRDGSASTAKLNYNIMLNEMQFITNRGDTIAIAYPETVKNITIDTTLFYYDKTYIQVIAEVDSFKLGRKQFYLQSPYRTRGGYDAPTAAGAITTYSSISSSSINARLQIKKDVQFEKEVFYLVSNQFNRFFKADKKSFLDIFPRWKSEIENYLTQNKINYLKETDVKKLLTFCVSLH